MSGLTQRRRNNAPQEQVQDEFEEQEKESRFTLLEEIILLGLKDNEGMLSFWNDNISYVLRGCILIELSLRNRVSVVKEPRKRPLQERLVQVDSDKLTGEVLLDEALRFMKAEQDSIANWIDLLSGETWNITKIGYQLKQVRERIAKGLVEKGVLRTEKVSYVLFDLPTHPVQDPSVKERVVQRVVDCLLQRGNPPDKRTIALVCAAYAANVLENALVGLSHSQREAAFTKVDAILQEHAQFSETARSNGTTEITAGSVF
ncbi:Golgi phosphoprotein 3 [Gorgonomyces haynaldii]|nr:Golgi phosphoprotein 3 [Gorgonomyces haynaldii]